MADERQNASEGCQECGYDIPPSDTIRTQNVVLEKLTYDAQGNVIAPVLENDDNPESRGGG